MEARKVPISLGSEDGQANAAPAGWLRRGSHPTDFDFGSESKPLGGGRRAFIRSRSEPNGFGTLMQMFRADAYRGKRWTVSASIGTDEVVEWCGLWMRVDGQDGKTLAFDNMEDRPIGGTTPVRNYQVVLDVADDAEYVAFGVLLSGKGVVWIEDFRFEETALETAVTGVVRQRDYPDEPMNLNFEE